MGIRGIISRQTRREAPRWRRGKVSLWRSRVWVCLAFALVLGLPLSYAGVTAAPASLTFGSLQQQLTVRLTEEGKPIPADGIRGWRLLADDHAYTPMFSYKKAAGALTLTPTERLEVGSYDLVIDTAAGSVTVKVDAPLDELSSVVETEAAKTGLSVEAVKRKLGLATESPRGEVTIELPPTYYEGQALRVSMPPNPTRTYVWTINGETIAQGPGKNSLVYVFKTVGNYLLGYAEQQNGKTVASTSAQTTVAPRPPIPWEVPRYARVERYAPEGFTGYTWSIDGKVVSVGPKFSHAFNQLGRFTVDCLAQSPKDGHPDEFVRLRYDTTVLSAKELHARQPQAQ